MEFGADYEITFRSSNLRYNNANGNVSNNYNSSDYAFNEQNETFVQQNQDSYIKNYHKHYNHHHNQKNDHIPASYWETFVYAFSNAIKEIQVENNRATNEVCDCFNTF